MTHRLLSSVAALALLISTSSAAADVNTDADVRHHNEPKQEPSSPTIYEFLSSARLSQAQQMIKDIVSRLTEGAITSPHEDAHSAEPTILASKGSITEILVPHPEASRGNMNTPSRRFTSWPANGGYSSWNKTDSSGKKVTSTRQTENSGSSNVDQAASAGKSDGPPQQNLVPRDNHAKTTVAELITARSDQPAATQSSTPLDLWAQRRPAEPDQNSRAADGQGADGSTLKDGSPTVGGPAAARLRLEQAVADLGRQYEPGAPIPFIDVGISPSTESAGDTDLHERKVSEFLTSRPPRSEAILRQPAFARSTTDKNELVASKHVAGQRLISELGLQERQDDSTGLTLQGQIPSDIDAQRAVASEAQHKTLEELLAATPLERLPGTGVSDTSNGMWDVPTASQHAQKGAPSMPGNSSEGSDHQAASTTHRPTTTAARVLIAQPAEPELFPSQIASHPVPLGDRNGHSRQPPRVTGMPQNNGSEESQNTAPPLLGPYVSQLLAPESRPIVLPDLTTEPSVQTTNDAQPKATTLDHVLTARRPMTVEPFAQHLQDRPAPRRLQTPVTAATPVGSILSRPSHAHRIPAQQRIAYQVTELTDLVERDPEMAISMAVSLYKEWDDPHHSEFILNHLLSLAEQIAKRRGLEAQLTVMRWFIQRVPEGEKQHRAQLRVGRLYYEHGHYGKAVVELPVDPDNQHPNQFQSLAGLYKAVSLIRLRRLTEALPLLEWIAERSPVQPQRTRAALLLGRLQLLYDNDRAARKWLVYVRDNAANPDAVTTAEEMLRDMDS